MGPLGHLLTSIIIYEERENLGLEVWCWKSPTMRRRRSPSAKRPGRKYSGDPPRSTPRQQVGARTRALFMDSWLGFSGAAV